MHNLPSGRSVSDTVPIGIAFPGRLSKAMTLPLLFQTPILNPRMRYHRCSGGRRGERQRDARQRPKRNGAKTVNVTSGVLRAVLVAKRMQQISLESTYGDCAREVAAVATQVPMPVAQRVISVCRS